MPSDFIADFISLTEGAVSPECFRLWSAISMLAAALGRRVSAKTGKGHLYPNLYVLLVGPPGAGKSIIDTAKEMLKTTPAPGSESPAFHVASDSVTSASLVDELAKAKGVKITPSGPPFISHSLIIAAEELQVLLPGYDTTVVGKLNSLYNNSTIPYSESRRTGAVRDISIENPNLNILAGAQPAYFSSTFPEEVWSTGFARRIIMIYSDEPQIASLWWSGASSPQLAASLQQRLSALSDLYGTVQWRKEAAEFIDSWHMSGGQPQPQHSKLAQYVRNRSVNAIKLSVISSVSRGASMIIELEDVKRAISWMEAAEARMPDIFRAMIGRSDSQVIEEMHLYAWSAWAKNRKPVTGGHLMRFLLHRVPSEKAERILQLAERANMLARVAGSQDLYIPKPKSEHEEVE